VVLLVFWNERKSISGLFRLNILKYSRVVRDISGDILEMIHFNSILEVRKIFLLEISQHTSAKTLIQVSFEL